MFNDFVIKIVIKHCGKEKVWSHAGMLHGPFWYPLRIRYLHCQ